MQSLRVRATMSDGRQRGLIVPVRIRSANETAHGASRFLADAARHERASKVARRRHADKTT